MVRVIVNVMPSVTKLTSQNTLNWTPDIRTRDNPYPYPAQPEKTMFRQQAIAGNRAFIVRQTFSNSEEDFMLEYQPVNSKTGKPWQATRTIARFSGPNAKAKAMRAWLYECVNARKGAN